MDEGRVINDPRESDGQKNRFVSTWRDVRLDEGWCCSCAGMSMTSRRVDDLKAGTAAPGSG